MSDSAPGRLKVLPSWLLNQSSLAAQRLVTDGLEAVGAHRYHYSLLAALDEFGPASQAALGRRCGIDGSDMVALVNELADRHVVDRTSDAVDRRRNVVAITAAGRRYLRKLDILVSKIQEELVAPLSSDERKKLVRLLAMIVSHHAEG
ncbi:MAG: MarR family transcriptional regulator, lower aerobic nicotinate degradation pathway regulator [Acidimicrobiaceae bacterium]|nr:MarR family transcriptional regulator, lower aerobic nicotinate degradation pathway regulator [Acidimicrobiaceae bacterium]